MARMGVPPQVPPPFPVAISYHVWQWIATVVREKIRSCHELFRFFHETRGTGIAVQSQRWITTGVPLGAQSYSHLAWSVRMLTQPWLIGVPKLLCQYVPWMAYPPTKNMA